MKKTYTTGEVARICGVAPRTVSKWFDAGRLRGYRIPGSNDRRIPRSALQAFLTAHGMPFQDGAMHRVLLVGLPGVVAGRLRELLPEGDDFRLFCAATGFEAGALAEASRPDTVIIDLGAGRSEGLAIASCLRRNPAHERAMLIALAGEDEVDPDGLAAGGFTEVFKKPFDVAMLAEKLRALAEGGGRG